MTCVDIDIPAILTGSGFEHVELVTEGADIAELNEVILTDTPPEAAP